MTANSSSAFEVLSGGSTSGLAQSGADSSSVYPETPKFAPAPASSDDAVPAQSLSPAGPSLSSAASFLEAEIICAGMVLKQSRGNHGGWKKRFMTLTEHGTLAL